MIVSWHRVLWSRNLLFISLVIFSSGLPAKRFVMKALTVGELKKKLSAYPDNYLVMIEHAEFDSTGNSEINNEVEIVGLGRPFSSESCVTLEASKVLTLAIVE